MSNADDRIEKQVVLKAPRARVWKAITDSRQYGAWFGADLDGPFEAGKPTKGRIAPTKVDAEVAKLQAPHAGLPMVLFVETVEPETTFSFRWHPSAVDPALAESKEQTTLVTFRLEDAPDGGTRLTITESGFESIPEARRKAALESNDGGWAHQCRMIETYLAHGT